MNDFFDWLIRITMQGYSDGFPLVGNSADFPLVENSDGMQLVLDVWMIIAANLDVNITVPTRGLSIHQFSPYGRDGLPTHRNNPDLRALASCCRSLYRALCGRAFHQIRFCGSPIDYAKIGREYAKRYDDAQDCICPVISDKFESREYRECTKYTNVFNNMRRHVKILVGPGDAGIIITFIGSVRVYHVYIAVEYDYSIIKWHETRPLVRVDEYILHRGIPEVGYVYRSDISVISLCGDDWDMALDLSTYAHVKHVRQLLPLFPKCWQLQQRHRPHELKNCPPMSMLLLDYKWFTRRGYRCGGLQQTITICDFDVMGKPIAIQCDQLSCGPGGGGHYKLILTAGKHTGPVSDIDIIHEWAAQMDVKLVNIEDEPDGYIITCEWVLD